jgi:D-threo-aldose 1-dehydrogenase
MEFHPLGTTGLTVSDLCVGTSPLGGMPHTYGYGVDEDRAIATVEAVFGTDINFLDTSNEYGKGESERRIGAAISRAGGLPEGFVLATKADPDARDFSAARVRRSFEESCERLGVERVDLFHLHDPERFSFEEIAAPGGALDGMRQLKDEGLVTAIGVAGGDLGEMERYVDLGVFDVLLNHNRFTLLDQSASPLMTKAVELGMTYLNAAPYASGLLAKPLEQKPRYRYQQPDAEVIARTERLRALCDSHGVDLAAVALQFSTRDPRVTSTLVGVSHPDRVRELVANREAVIPDELWDELAEVIAHDG